MSRRDSRNSLGARQSNALEEFENFKKKYLLVNKHIAKLNSSLNVRIEELLSKIAELNIDNLRLRASELSLSRKLESEQEKSRRLYMEAEAATQLFYSQITSLRDEFGIGKSAGTNPLREQAAAARNRLPKIPAPPIARLARPPEFETLAEAAEESTPPRSSRRTAYSPPPDPVTPVSRHRSTGSTPTSGTAAETTKTPPPGQEENRRSSVPLSMEITNGSSPLTACISSVENLALSPSPTQSPKDDKGPPSVAPAATPAVEKLPESKDEIPHMTFKLNGLRRISRRPSGLLMTEQDKFGVPPAKNTAMPVSVEIPSLESKAGQGSYPTPLSAKDVPSTPPRSRSMLAPPGVSPATSTKSIPMSPVLSANPALSPPPTKKISLTRRQLDFGIVDSEDQSDEDDDAESGEKMPVAEGLLGIESDSVVGKRAMKRKEPEDGDDIFSAAPKPATSRKRQERRRDTGPVHTGMVLQEKSSIDTILKDRESKDSLRDVTNERTTPPLVIRPTDEKPKISVGIGIGKPAPSVKSAENGIPPLSVAGLAAKLERLSTRPKPPAPPAPLPLPSSDKDVKIPLADEDVPVDAKPESVGAELGRRESGRQRKSVNYKEPSLLSKMRKPDPGPQSSSSAPSSSGSFTTTSLQAAQKPPRRKKGSISLIGDVVNDSTASLVSNEGETRIASGTVTGEMPQPIDIDRKRRRTAPFRRFGDLSDDDDDDSEEDQPGNTKQSTPAPNQSRYTFSGLQGLRGPSILSRGANPIVGSAPPSASSASETISVAVARTTAALRMAPGAARERLREEITSGITSGARREREKERLREEERERERERARETPNDVAV